MPMPPDMGYSQFALGQNLANAQDVRNSRMADQMAEAGEQHPIGYIPSHGAIGGPVADPRWDAFFGGVQQTQQAANDAGMGFKLGMQKSQKPQESPAVGQLRTAFAKRYPGVAFSPELDVPKELGGWIAPYSQG